MKSKGIVRKIDELGRIVIPKEIRNKMGIDTGTPLEIRQEGDSIVMRLDTTSCIFCGGDECVIDYKGKSICHTCLADVKGLIYN